MKNSLKGIGVTLVLAAICLPKASSAQITLPIKWANSQVFNPQCVAYSPDGRWIAVGGWGGAILYDRKTGAIKNIEPLTGVINNIGFSPNSRTVALTTFDTKEVGETELWNVDTGALAATIREPSDRDGVMAFAPVGSTIAVAGLTKSGKTCVQLWDTIAVKPIQTFQTSFQPKTVAFSTNGKQVACGGWSQSGSSIQIWDRATGKLQRTISTSSTNDLLKIAFSPDGMTIADCGGYSLPGSVKLWDVATGQLKLSLPTSAVLAAENVAYSIDGKTLAVVGHPGGGKSCIELWNPTTGKLIENVPSLETGGTYGVAFSQDRKGFATVGSNDSVSSTSDGSCILELWNPNGTPAGIAYTAQTTATGPASFFNNGKLLAVPATSFVNGADKNVLDLYDVPTGKLLAATTYASQPNVNSVAYSPTHNQIAVAKSVGTSSAPATDLKLVDPLTGTSILTLDASALSAINSMAFSPDGSHLYATTGNNTQKAYIFDAVKGGAPSEIPDLSIIFGVLNSQSQNTLAFLSAYGMSLEFKTWDLKAQKWIGTITPNVGGILGYALSPDGRTLAVEGAEVYTQGQGTVYATGSIEIWDVNSSTRIKSLGGIQVGLPFPNTSYAMAFSPDGQYLLAVLNNPLAVSMADFSMQDLFNGSSHNMEFSPDGALIASAPWGELGVNVARNPLFGLVTPSTLSLSLPLVKGGSVVTATIHLQHPAPPKGAYLTLSTSDPHASLPVSILIPAGKKTVTFTVQTQKVSAKTTVKITASAGIMSAGTTLTIS